MQDCSFRGGFEACVIVEEDDGNELTQVTVHRASFSPYVEGHRRLSRAGLSVIGSTRVLLHLTQTRFATEEPVDLVGLADECYLRLQGGSCLLDSCFMHGVVGPRPALPSTDTFRDDVTPANRATLRYADGQDIFLEAPIAQVFQGRVPEWSHLTVIMVESESWSHLASEDFSVLHAGRHPILLQGVMANNVNLSESGVPATVARHIGALEPADRPVRPPPPPGSTEVQPLVVNANFSPLSVVLGGNPGPLVLVGCRFFGATALGDGVAAYDVGVAYKPLGFLDGATAYVTLAFARRRTSPGQHWSRLPFQSTDNVFSRVPRLDLIERTRGVPF